MKPYLLICLCIVVSETGHAWAAPSDSDATRLALPEPPAASSPANLATQPPRQPDEVVGMVQRLLTEPFDPEPAAEELKALRSFYAEVQHPLWISGTAWSPRATAVMEEIKHSGDWGLDPAAFDIPELNPETADETANIPALADAEMRLSLAALKYARYARGGRIPDPATQLSAYIDRKPQLEPPMHVLQELAAAERPGRYLRGLNPRQPQFEKLRRQYVAMRGGTEPPMPRLPEEGDMLVAGGSHPDVALVRRRLGVTEEPSTPDLYDDGLREAVKAFQREHGLRADGIIGPLTRRELNEGQKASPEAILANMEEWRWMPADLGDTYVWVNIPEFLVRAVEHGKVVHTAPVVVGKADTETPLFSQDLETLYFRPRWYVPDSIKQNEILPRLRRGGGGGYEIVKDGRKVARGSVRWSRADVRNYVIYQPSGPGNALGLVKFTFPNKHAVYMHDTPSKGLFAADVRTFSHGCIRVKDPAKLAQVLLAIDQGMAPKEIARLMDDAPDNHPVALQKRIPVHITYFTAWVDESGQLRTAADVYGHEKRITLALQGKWDEIDKSKPAEVETEETAEAQSSASARSSAVRKWYASQAATDASAAPRGNTANDIFRRNFGY